jgi:hypothetical protein
MTKNNKAYYAVVDNEIVPTLALAARVVGLSQQALHNRISRCKQITYKTTVNGKSIEVFSVNNHHNEIK